MTNSTLYGLAVEFEKPGDVLEATRTAWEAGYREMDAYTPYPVEGLSVALGMKRTRLPSIVFVGGLVGAGVGFAMQYYSMVIDYPFNSGGRPLNSWPAFIVVSFELLILVASFSAFLGMLLLNGLPRPNHPIFSMPGFERASQDRFFLCIEAADPHFDSATTFRFLSGLTGALQVAEVFEEQLVDVPLDEHAAEPEIRPERRVPATQAQER
jgi:hypothetical protein